MVDRQAAEEELHATVSVMVERLVRARGPKKKELAALLGITPDNLSHTLALGKAPRRRWWKITELFDLADYYGVPFEVLSGRDREGWDDLMDELLVEIDLRERDPRRPA